LVQAKFDRGGEVKIQNSLRMQVVVIAIGAAFLLAGATHAQEIDNPSFDEGPNSVPFAQPLAAATSGGLNSAAAGSRVMVASAPAAVTTKPVAEQAGLISGNAYLGVWMIATMAVCLALFTLLVRMETRRRRAHFNRHRVVGGLPSKAAIA
jgi:hypothetical protein